MNEGILAWHFLAENGCTCSHPNYPPPVKVEVGQTLRESRPLVMCQVGLHASINALHALQYAPGPIACRVRMSGNSATSADHTDKVCHSERTTLAMDDSSVLLHEFACWCAEAALNRERAADREPDSRSWAAIEAKRAWLHQEITAEELIATRSAACDAAVAVCTTSGAACDAAWSAANAARLVAISASWHAAGASSSAAGADVADRAVAWHEINTELERRLLDLLRLKEEK